MDYGKTEEINRSSKAEGNRRVLVYFAFYRRLSCFYDTTPRAIVVHEFL